MGFAIAAIETTSIAQGVVAADAMLKTASVELLAAATLSPGKYAVVVGGEVAAVRASIAAGIAVAAETLVDSLFIPQLDPQVLPALRGTVEPRTDDAFGVIETHTVAAIIRAADTAAKSARVWLRDLRLANGIGGKGVLFLSGSVSDVQAAIEAGKADAQKRGLLARAVVIPRLHVDLQRRLS